MSRKVRNDAKLKGLARDQRARVDGWLFEEGWTYAAVVEGCWEQFGLKLGKSSVGRYYERASADRLAMKRRKERMARMPKLSPAEAYKELLKRIAELALEEMDQPLKDINHRVVVRLVRVLISARRERHQETRVSVERRKAENYLAKQCLRYMREEMKKRVHPVYLPGQISHGLNTDETRMVKTESRRGSTTDNRWTRMKDEQGEESNRERGERDRRVRRMVMTNRCLPIGAEGKTDARIRNGEQIGQELTFVATKNERARKLCFNNGRDCRLFAARD